MHYAWVEHKNLESDSRIGTLVMIQSLIRNTLASPKIFELQEKLCNNYSAVRDEFSGILDKAPARILDIGCAMGTCAGSIVDMKANKYVGVDISPEYIKLAKKRYPDGAFEAMDARKLPFEDGSFDLAMFIGVLHHMEEQLALDCLESVRRVLKPNGRIIVAEPVYTSGDWLSTLFLNFDRGKYIRDDAGYRKLFGNFSLERQRFFRFSIHRCSSYVFRLQDQAA